MNLSGLPFAISSIIKKNEPLYIEFLRKQLTQFPSFKAFDEASIIAEVLSSDCLTISRPVTSGGLLARQCSMDSIFYDPNNELFNYRLEATGMQLIKGPEKLDSVLKQHIKSYKNGLIGRM